MSLIDFVKNYSFKSQNEVQEKHGTILLLMILVHVTNKY
jgi:hypothetical protein